MKIGKMRYRWLLAHIIWPVPGKALTRTQDNLDSRGASQSLKGTLCPQVRNIDTEEFIATRHGLKYTFRI